VKKELPSVEPTRIVDKSLPKIKVDGASAPEEGKDEPSNLATKASLALYAYKNTSPEVEKLVAPLFMLKTPVNGESVTDPVAPSYKVNALVRSLTEVTPLKSKEPVKVPAETVKPAAEAPLDVKSSIVATGPWLLVIVNVLEVAVPKIRISNRFFIFSLKFHLCLIRLLSMIVFVLRKLKV